MISIAQSGARKGRRLEFQLSKVGESTKYCSWQYLAGNTTCNVTKRRTMPEADIKIKGKYDRNKYK